MESLRFNEISIRFLEISVRGFEIGIHFQSTRLCVVLRLGIDSYLLCRRNERKISFSFRSESTRGNDRNADDLLKMLKRKLTSLSKEARSSMRSSTLSCSTTSRSSSSARIVEEGGENLRIDEDDDEAYPLSSFIEVYGDEDGKARYEERNRSTQKRSCVEFSVEYCRIGQVETHIFGHESYGSVE